MKNFLLFIFCVLVSSAAFGQILNETFDTDGNFTKSNAFFSDGSGDYFGIAGTTPDFDLGGTSNPSSVSSYTNLNGNYLVGEDFDGDGNPNTISLTWSGLNISGYTNLEFSGLFAQGVANKIDPSQDKILVEIQIDGGGYQNILAFEADISTGFNSNFSEDTDFNGVGDGTTLTSVATAFVKSIAGTGSILDLRLTLSVDSGDEEFGIDDIQITGTLSSSPNILLTSISGNTTEAGGTATFDVVLNTAPTTDVVIDVASGNTAENTVSPTTLTFTNGNYNIAQTVTVTGVDDAINDGNQTTTLTLSVNDAMSDNAYDGLSKTIDVINEDDDCGISNVSVVSGCNGNDATVVVSWTESNTSGTVEVDVDGNGYVTMTSGGTYTITGPTTAATGVTVTVRDANETTCFGTAITDIFLCPQPIPDIFISEVSDASSSSNEFLELYNNSDFSVNLLGYKLVQVVASTNTSEYVFDIGTDETASGSGSDLIIDAKGFMVITRGATSRADFTTAFSSFPAGSAFSRGNSSLFIGTGTARRWRLRANDGTANTDDGTLIDDTNDAVAGSSSRNYQNLPGTFVSANSSTATPGEFDAGQELPVELLNFTAQANNQTTILTWATATEENNAYFNIQRSTDGKNFETIGTKAGAGTTYEVQEYAFIDESPVNGLNYYRLQQVDFDGKFENHKIVSVLMNGKASDVQIYPNPTRGTLNIVLPTTGENEIQILDLTGKIVRTSITNDEGMTTLDISDLANGQYVIKIRNAQAISTALFVKTK